MRIRMLTPRAIRIGLLVLLYGSLSMASAQWAWRDENGRPVYSDQPPPANIKAADILQQPQPAPQNPSDALDGMPGQAPASAPGGASAGRPADAEPGGTTAGRRADTAPKSPTMAEREREFQKRMKERAEAEKKVADAQARADQKASDCERARGYAKSLDDGVRLIRTNPDGSREMMDEEQRAAEAKRTRDIIDSNCN
jgi:hypothetical protein